MDLEFKMQIKEFENEVLDDSSELSMRHYACSLTEDLSTSNLYLEK